MTYFTEGLAGMVPVMEKSYEMHSGYMRQFVWLRRLPRKEHYSLSYLQPVECFMQNDGSISGKRIFLVAEEETVAIKAALCLLDYPAQESEEVIMPTSMRVVHLGVNKSNDMTLQNMYEPLFAGVRVNQAAFICGLEEGTFLEDKLDALRGCKWSIQFIMVHPEQLGATWIRDLMKEQESELIHIPKVCSEYYERITNELLEAGEYQLEKKLSVGQLVRSIRKKCGNRFSEEDIAWSLDWAVKNVSEENRYELTGADFTFEALEEVSAMQKLQSMTGLDNIKEMAVEYAALSREMLWNDKLKDICKHVIFKGNPGTGKTMCGELLARILADYGQSNGNFIVVARKDLIGEYIGHTAPKVAKAFERARDGVLFVDEAGFFLQDIRKGYCRECIKEFVRYMELYQDVTVIFAMYSHEVEGFMDLDVGISSRIGRIVEFADYTKEELIQIAKGMCKERGYTMAKNASKHIAFYIDCRKNVLENRFGNAREMRKLVEAAIFARSLRCFEKVPKEKTPLLTAKDFEKGACRLQREQEAFKDFKVIGFASC